MKNLLKGILFVTAIAVLILISCNANVVSNDNDVVSISFGGLQQETKSLGASVEHKSPAKLYWRYTAVKKDNGGTQGQVYPDKQSPTLAELISVSKPVTTETDKWVEGLDGDHAFSVGSWEFSLYAFSSPTTWTDLTYIYSGTAKATVVSSTKIKVTVGVSPVSDSGSINGFVGLSENIQPHVPGNTVKYSFDGLTWITETDTPKPAGSYVVYVGEFNNGGESQVYYPSTICATVYRGLTTYVGGSCDPIEGITVTFDPNGGTVTPTTKKVMVGGTYGALPTPTRENFTFAGWSLVPAGYQQVEYIQSNGSSYIDTGVKCSSTDILEISGRVAYISEDKRNFIFTSKNSDYSHYCEFGNGCFGICAANSWEKGVKLLPEGGSLAEKKPYEVSLIVSGKNSTQVSITNADFSGTGVTESYQGVDGSSYCLGLGFSYSKATSKIRYYSVVVKLNGEIVRNFVPCYRTYDSVVGMYDTKRGEFYAGKGFTSSSDIGYVTSTDKVDRSYDHTLYAIWDGYQKLKYIETTGSQYIDTGVHCSSTDILEISGTVAYTTLDCRNVVFSSRNSSYSHYCEFGTDTSNNKCFGIRAVGSWEKGVKLLPEGGSLAEQTPYEVSLIVSGTDLTKVSITNTDFSDTGETKSYQGEDDSSYCLGLGFSYSGVSSKIRYYSVVVKLNGEIVMNFVPCYDTKNDRPGMYDRKNNIFYTNKGSGDDFGYELLD